MASTVIHKQVDILSTCPLFRLMDRGAIRNILLTQECEVAAYGEGAVLPSDRGMLVLLSGSIVIEKQTWDGRYLRMREAQPGDAINVTALSGAVPGEMSRMTAPAGCVVVVLSRAFITNALLEGGQFSVNLVDFLLSRVVYLNRKITALSGSTAVSRVAVYLEDHAVPGPEGLQVVLPCSLSQFAEILCVGRASLYRTLDAMEEEGRIRRKGRTIRLLEVGKETETEKTRR